MKGVFYIVVLVFLFTSCNGEKTSVTQVKSIELEKNDSEVADQVLVDHDGTSIKDRFQVPDGYKRTTLSKSTFGHYLRNLPLKKIGSAVHYYDGSIKNNNNVYVGVVDLEIGNKDLHQCADAIMRLRAEYFWHRENYDKIHFNFTNGHKVEYKEWMKGKRMKVEGNHTSWVQKENPSNSYQDFWNYLELIFMYAGTSSLEKEMKSVDLSDVRVGDVLIQGGFPGHAVIIVDEAEHIQTGSKIFMLAQSYMPAQELQIISNQTGNFSPWYVFKHGVIFTPEWTFESSDFRRFVE